MFWRRTPNRDHLVFFKYAVGTIILDMTALGTFLVDIFGYKIFGEHEHFLGTAPG